MSVLWLTGFGDATVADPAFARRIANRELAAALGTLARSMDAIWMVLASICIYLSLVQMEGIMVARRWSATVLAAGFALPAMSALSQWPLGPVFYPQNLGLKIGPVPFTLPLLWFIVIVGAREAAWRLFPRASHGGVAAAAAIFALLTDANLEPLAWKYRAWWIWYPGPAAHAAYPPWSNFVTWFAASLALCWLMRTPHLVPRVTQRPLIAVGSLAFLNLLALATQAFLHWA